MENDTLTAVPGVQVGHWTHASGTTGCTAVLFREGARGGLWVPGSAPGSREWGALDPTHLAGEVHGAVLSGGSAFGLATADGVMALLEQQGVGFDTGFGRVPIVPAAILFDLQRAEARPDAAAGRRAAAAATDSPVAQGAVGAAAGALVARSTGNPVPGGLGSASSSVGSHSVGAIAAVNAVGSVFDPSHGEWVAGGPASTAQVMDGGDWRGQTTLVLVATDAPLSRPQCQVLAKMATAGMARTLFPAFAPFDGDVVMAFSTGRGEPVDAFALAALGDAAAAAVARAIVRGVRAVSDER